METTNPSDPPVGGEKIRFRMSASEYLELEKKLSPPAITDATSILNAGQKLGIQVALRYFRENFVQGL